VFGIFQAATASDQSNSACPTLADVNFPDDVVISDDQLELNSLTSELRPDSLILNYGFTLDEVYPTWADPDDCQNVNWSYTDLNIDIDGESFKVLRTWYVLDWLTNEFLQEYQVILNLPNGESQEYCNGTINVAVSPWSCDAVGVNPEAFLVSGFDYENVSMTPDASTEFGLGNHCVVIEATLGNEEITCYSTLIVQDLTPPVPIVEAEIDLSLDNNCIAIITPEMIDDGSHDGDCGEITLSVEPSILTIDDAGSVVLVTLTVEDESGNTNTAVTEINVLPCDVNTIFQCIPSVTALNNYDNGIQLYPEDLLTQVSTPSNDLSLTFIDAAGNTIIGGILQPGIEGSFQYTVTDNITGESCTGNILIVLGDPCALIACKLYFQATMPETGIATFTAQDFSLNINDCVINFNSQIQMEMYVGEILN